MDVIVLIVGTLLGVVLGYLIGRWHRSRTHVALHTADPAVVVSGTANYPRQAVSWNGVTPNGAPYTLKADFGSIGMPLDDRTPIDVERDPAWKVSG